MAQFVKVFVLILTGSVQKSFRAMTRGLTIHIETRSYLGSLLSTQEARVALGYRLEQLLRFFRV